MNREQQLVDMESSKLPSKIEMSSWHIGAIGEALFTARYSPPDPIPELIREFCEGELPDGMDGADLSIQSLAVEDTFSIKKGNNEMRWEADAVVSAFYSPSHTEREQSDQPLPMDWTRRFPVEIKTGPEATTRNDQLEVMEHLAENTEQQAILVRLDIKSLPESFQVTDIRFIGH